MTGSVPAEILDTPFMHRLTARAGSTDPAFTYLDCSSGEHAVERTVTWTELIDQVRSVSAGLRRLAGQGDRVAILCAQDLGYVTAFLGALHAGVIAVPLFAPEVRSHRARLKGALLDCDAKVWLTSEHALARLTEFAKAEDFGDSAEIVSVESLVHKESTAEPAAVALDDPAYLQYTSGSTRDPAGAVITHRALLSSCWQSAQAYWVGTGTTCAGWIPFFHDMGLIQLLCLPVFAGARSVFMPPLEFIRRPVRWLEQMSTYPDVFTAAPNFAFDLVVEAVPESQRSTMDLSGVRVALNGSEPVRPATVAAFAEAFGPHGFAPEAHQPSYGLAEATVYVASAGKEGPVVTAFDREALARGQAVAVPRGTEGARELVSVGRPVGQLVRIVGEETRQLRPDGEMGEVWVHGPHVAAGYWRQPERTAETFGGHIENAPPDLPAGGWLRTGDLGVLHDGRLYLTGRIKDLIIVDGKNVYPQDIEDTVAKSHPAVRADRVAAFAVGTEDGERVVVMAEPARGTRATDLDIEAITRAARRAVSAEHDVVLSEVRLVEPGSVPRTSSGKVARSAAKTRFLDEEQ